MAAPAVPAAPVRTLPEPSLISQRPYSLVSYLIIGDWRKEITWVNFLAADSDHGTLSCLARRVLRVVAIALGALGALLADYTALPLARWFVMRKLNQLEVLGLCHLREARDWDIPKIIGSKRVELSLNNLYESEELQNLASRVDSSQEMSIQVSEYQVGAIPSVALSFKNVRHLRIESSRTVYEVDVNGRLRTSAHIPDPGGALAMIAQAFPELETLTLREGRPDFNGRPDLTKGVEALANSCPHLQSLYLGLAHLSDAGLQGMENKLAQLKAFQVKGAKFTDDGFIAFVQNHPNLEIVCLEKCGNRDNLKRALAAQFPNLKVSISS